jgi:hypothetical protein
VKSKKHDQPKNMGDQRWPLSDFPPPAGITVLCFAGYGEIGELGIVVLNGHLNAFRYVSATGLPDNASVAFLAAGEFLNNRTIEAFKRKGKWSCEVCTSDNGLRRAKSCIHCQASQWIEWYRLSH